MCARFEFKSTSFAGFHPELLKLMDDLLKEEYYPSEKIPFINAYGGVVMGEWGFRPAWGKQLLITARSETLLQKEVFRPLLDHPCAVPATAYFEWLTSGKQKIKHRIFLPNAESFFLAGLHSPEGRFVLLTKSAEQSISAIHDRMPVILKRDSYSEWVTPDYGRRLALLESAKKGIHYTNARSMALPAAVKPAPGGQMSFF